MADKHNRAKPLKLVRRILFVNHAAALGGGEIALLNLVRQLNGTGNVPVVALFSDGPLVARLRDSGVETHVLPLSRSVVQARKDSLGAGSLLQLRGVGATMAHVWRLSRFIRGHQIDLVHTNSLKADVIGGLAAKLAGKPLIWHVRDRIADDYLPPNVGRLFRLLCRVIPDYVLANSAATLRTVVAPGVGGPSPEPDGTVSTTRPSSAADRQSANTESARAARPIRAAVVHDGVQGAGGRAHPRAPTDRNAFCRIGLVGRISRWKGQHVFLRAAALVRDQFPLTRFQIIGAPLFDEQGYEREVRELVTALSLGHSVEFTGFRSDVAELIAGLDILVHASITGEPFGQVVIEGMAAGKPVVATRGGGIPEIVVDGVTGVLVPMGDATAMARAICRILADPEAGREMGRRGCERVAAQFTIQHTARRVAAVYDEVLNSRRTQ